MARLFIQDLVLLGFHAGFSPGLGIFLQMDYVTRYNNTAMITLIVHYSTLYSDQVLGGGG